MLANEGGGKEPSRSLLSIDLLALRPEAKISGLYQIEVLQIKILAIDTGTKIGECRVPRQFQERNQRVEGKYTNVTFAPKNHIYTD
jgi:hypothetical protein